METRPERITILLPPFYTKLAHGLGLAGFFKDDGLKVS
jgi:hypothetical protein